MLSGVSCIPIKFSFAQTVLSGSCLIERVIDSCRTNGDVWVSSKMEFHLSFTERKDEIAITDGWLITNSFFETEITFFAFFIQQRIR